MKKTIIAVAATVVLASNVYAEAPDNGDSLSAAFWASSVTHDGSVKPHQNSSASTHNLDLFQTNKEN